MNLFIGITDGDWYRYLRSRPDLDAVNFWQPRGNRQFRSLTPGEPFLFKLHSPQDFIVGGGFFTHFSILPCSLAWESFEEKNGASSLLEMRRRIERYRRNPPHPHEDYAIGCIILRNPFFFDESDWIPTPKEWSKNIVQGKKFVTTQGVGTHLWEAVQLKLVGNQILHGISEERAIYGKPILITPRLGQGSFRVIITDIYNRRCAVTGEKALPVLEAAHIKPVAEGGNHRIDNGLLLRSDLHRLFDRGYVTITSDYRFLVSDKLRTALDNGEIYYPFNRQEIWLPPKERLRPNREYLEWHADTLFRREIFASSTAFD